MFQILLADALADGRSAMSRLAVDTGLRGRRARPNARSPSPGRYIEMVGLSHARRPSPGGTQRRHAAARGRRTRALAMDAGNCCCSTSRCRRSMP